MLPVEIVCNDTPRATDVSNQQPRRSPSGREFKSRSLLLLTGQIRDNDTQSVHSPTTTFGIPEPLPLVWSP